MLTVVMVRAKPHGENREREFLSGEASLGWPDTGDLTNADRATIETQLRQHHPDGPISLNASQVHRFVSLPVGSIILTPSYETRDIHIFRTSRRYEYRRERVKDGNPHVICVEHIRTVARGAFPERVQKAMLAAKKAVTDFSKYAPFIIAVVNGDEHGVPRQTTASASESVTDEAVRTLRELLGSANEEVRLQAAMTLLSRRAL